MSLKTSIYEIKVARIRLENNKKKRKKEKDFEIGQVRTTLEELPVSVWKTKTKKKKKEKERLV